MHIGCEPVRIQTRVALRSANLVSNKSWRILHRVTYVNRVPAPFNAIPDQSNAKLPSQAVTLVGNTMLVALVKKALAGDPTAVNVGAAITKVLDPPTGLPPITTYVNWWPAFLAKAKATGANADPEAAAALRALRLDVLKYMVAGYAAGIIS